MAGDFNPANGLIRHAWETVEGIADEDNWHDHEFVSEEFSPEYTTIVPESITRNAQTPEGQPSKIRGGGAMPVEWDCENYARYLANVQRFGADPVDLSGGSLSVFQHKLAPSETDVEFPDTMTVEVSRDDDLPQLSRGCRVGSVGFNLSESSFLTGDINVIPARMDYWEAGERVDVLGGATPVAPTIRGIPSYDNWILANHNITFKATVVNAGVSVVGLFKVGGGAYGATTTTLLVGNDSQGRPRWIEAIDSNGGDRIGTRDLPVEVHLSATTNWVVNAEYRFDGARAVWVPVYADVPKFNEIFARILIADAFGDLESYEIDEFSLEITRPADPKMTIGGRYPARVKTRGRRTVSGSIKREYLATALRKRLERAKAFWLRMDAYDGQEIDAGYEGSISLISGRCVLGGKTPTIGGQDSMDENYDFTCHPGSDGTYPDDLTILLVNSQASLAAGT